METARQNHNGINKILLNDSGFLKNALVIDSKGRRLKPFSQRLRPAGQVHSRHQGLGHCILGHVAGDLISVQAEANHLLECGAVVLRVILGECLEIVLHHKLKDTALFLV